MKILWNSMGFPWKSMEVLGQMAFMFKALGAEELNIVIDAMEEKKFNQG